MDDRVVALEGAHNLRDLGGLPVNGGGKTRRGVIYRSEFLADPRTHGAVGGLHPLGIRTVVDLRLRGELESEQVPWEKFGIDVEHRPLRLARGTSWRAGYDKYLTNAPAKFVAAAEAIIRVENQPVLFHCAAGKDRTGTMAAVILQLAGVAEAAIVEDYAMTAEQLRPIMERLIEVEPYRGQIAGTTYLDHLPEVEKVESLLAWMNQEHGGPAGWLVRHGLSSDVIDSFRARFVVR